MKQFRQQVKRYGNSYMLVVPAHIVKKEMNLKDREWVSVTLEKDEENNKLVEDTFKEE